MRTFLRAAPWVAATAWGLAAAFYCTCPAWGDVIGINFLGLGTKSGTVYVRPLDPAESAGAPGCEQANWNNASGASNTGGLALITRDGTASGATTTWTFADKAYVAISDATGDGAMMRGYLGQFPGMGPLSVTVSGLGAPFTVHGYSVIVYFDGENATKTSNQDWVTEYLLAPAGGAAQSVFGKDAGGTNFGGTYVRATGATAAGASAGNYLRFDGLMASAFTLTATPVSGDGPVNAIQIISAPEPTTAWLLAAGLGAVHAAVSRRRRRGP